MGITNGNKILWSAESVALKDIHEIYHHLQKGCNNPFQICQIDVDVSNIVHIHAHGKAYRESLNIIAHYLKRLAHCGNFLVTAILDGLVHLDFKRASVASSFTRYISKINAFYCRKKINGFIIYIYRIQQTKNQSTQQICKVFKK